VYEYDDKGLRDIIPALKGNDDETASHHNKTSYRQCTYHIYRKYACVQVAITGARSPASPNGKLLQSISEYNLYLLL
jgi:hypothetical protein